MPKEIYETRRISEAKMRVIAQADAICTEYQDMGFTLTLRQLYYQFVARGLIPNNMQEYKKLGDAVNHGRLNGLIDWEAIEDRTRNLRELATWDSPGDILQQAANQYRIDVWADQPWALEVWIEKDALVGVIEQVCDELRMPYFACRGYSSQSEQWRAGCRIKQRAVDRGQKTIILHLGDHDPSGIDMTRDNRDRLHLFTLGDAYETCFVRRLALNMDQVEEHRPPPNPAKLSDSRAKTYIAMHGESSWELDALEPSMIDQLIREAAAEHIDQGAWDASMEQEAEQREWIQRIAEEGQQ